MLVEQKCLNLYMNLMLLIRTGISKTYNRILGLIDYNRVKRNRTIISRSDLSQLEINKLLYLTQFGIKYETYINEYLDCILNLDQQSDDDFSDGSPILICVEKDDLMRVKLLIDHYSSLGVRRFAFVDDGSKEDTLLFFKGLQNCEVFKANKAYTTVRRQVWINKVINYYGYNRWYIIVDSDELLSFGQETISEFISFLDKKGLSSAKAILLDMFSPHCLYDDSVKEYNDITRIYDKFSNNYRLEIGNNDIRIRGGARELFFDFSHNKTRKSPVVSKYPVIKVGFEDILIDSHYYVSANNKLPSYPDCILRHYKFLPQDKEKYFLRVNSGVFKNNSAEYKVYLNQKFDRESYSKVVSGLHSYVDYTSCSVIDILK